MPAKVSFKCPKCKKFLKRNELKSSHSNFGTPIIRCRYCFELIQTGKKLWRDMSFEDKLWFYVSISATSFWWGIISLMIFLLPLQYLPIPDNMAIYVIVGFPILIFCLLLSKQIKNMNEVIQLYEDDYDNKTYQYEEY